MEKQRKYNREFKINAVKLYQESRKNLTEIAQNLGIPKSTLASWVGQLKEEGKQSFRGSGNIPTRDINEKNTPKQAYRILSKDTQVSKPLGKIHLHLVGNSLSIEQFSLFFDLENPYATR